MSMMASAAAVAAAPPPHSPHSPSMSGPGATSTLTTPPDVSHGEAPIHDQVQTPRSFERQQQQQQQKLGALPDQQQQQRQIRFVNNEGQPPVKRRRIGAACRTCRKRKTRCDGMRPRCSTCTDNGHDCLGYAPGQDGAGGGAGGNGHAKRALVATEMDLEREDDDNHTYGTNMTRRASEMGHKNRRMAGDDRSSSRNQLRPSHMNGERMAEPRVPDGAGNLRYQDAEVFMEEDEKEQNHVEPSPRMRDESHRVPYFRYFGPTAIVPGFKQMVVSVREHRRSTGAGSSAPVAMSPSTPGFGGSAGSTYGGTPSQAGSEPRSSVDMPIYDVNDPLPVHRLIIHLLETFFARIGCNYPFLKKERFIPMVENKRVDAILVDAICSLAARFSDHPLLCVSHDSSYLKSEYGHVFAQRAKAAVVDTFPCPTVAAVQACLLLAYEGFGANQDSALWMYLGCAIRMAVDLGLQKLDGVKHQGQKDPGHHRASIDGSSDSSVSGTVSVQEKSEIEQERVDTLWAVFMLDRVISSGTGRPVTLRDQDFELAFPAMTTNADDSWPKSFPALIQIIHLYGRVSDLLNNIRHVNDVDLQALSGVERDLTQLYQRLDPRLTFNASNFQHSVKSGEGTNFILVHFWFHTLIILLHQPMLMHSFEGEILKVLPNDRELSMSSAKTIADILAFAELIDPRSFIGNPFTSQPIYIAACAFLMETAAHTASQPTSRDTSPPRNGPKSGQAKEKGPDQKQKHSLLASAANQNYQRCYKSLQQLETYWAGTRYILVALDQKASGIWDPETYTVEEYEATKTRHDMIPSWRGKLPIPVSSPGAGRLGGFSPRPDQLPGSPSIDPATAIGWALTGTTNSPSSNLTFMYQNINGEQLQLPPPPAPGVGTMTYDPIRQSSGLGSTASTGPTSARRNPSYPRPRVRTPSRANSHNSSHVQQQMPPPAAPTKYTPSSPPDPASTSDAEMLLGLTNSPSPFAASPHGLASPTSGLRNGTPHPSAGGHGNGPHAGAFDYLATHPFSPSQGPAGVGVGVNVGVGMAGMAGMHLGVGVGVGVGVGDMMMESQEIDMSTLAGDMMPWLEYLPQDVLSFFDGSGHADGGGEG